jgi:hypothetical protein
MLVNRQSAAADHHNASHLRPAERLVSKDMRAHGDDCVARSDPRGEGDQDWKRRRYRLRGR